MTARNGHLADDRVSDDDGFVIWRRHQPAPALPLDRDDVLAIFDALADIRAWTHDILAILEGDDGDDVEP